MPSSQPQGKSWPFAAGVLGAPILYVLSVGPVQLLPPLPQSIEQAIETVYWPLRWIMDHVPPFETAIYYYLSLWP